MNKSIPFFGLIALFVGLLTLSPISARATQSASISYTSSLVESAWKYDFTVSNTSTDVGTTAFNIFLAPSVNYLAATGPSGWQIDGPDSVTGEGSFVQFYSLDPRISDIQIGGSLAHV